MICANFYNLPLLLTFRAGIHRSIKRIWLTDETCGRYQFTGEEAPMLLEEMVENPESDWDEDDEEEDGEDDEDEEADNQWNVPALD